MYNRKSVLMNLKGGHYNQYKTRSLSSIDSRWLGQDDLPIIDYTKIGTSGISSKKVPWWAISRLNLGHIDDDHDDQGGH